MARTAVIIAIATLTLTGPQILAPASCAAGELQIGPVGGLSVPAGDLDDIADRDFAFGGSIGYVLNEYFAVGTRISFHSFDPDMAVFDEAFPGRVLTSDASLDVLEYGVHAKYLMPLPHGPARPYLTVGLGFYRGHSSYEAEGISAGDPMAVEIDETETELGMHLGAGIDVKITSSIGIGFTPAFHVVFDKETIDEEEVGPTQFISLLLRLYFILPLRPAQGE